MTQDRAVLRTTAAVERRPAVAATMQRSPAPAVSSVRAIQQRLGHQASQALIARSIAEQRTEANPRAPPVSSREPPVLRLSAKVSSAHDPAELEAEETARKVMRTQPPASAPKAGRAEQGAVQREAASAAPVAAAVAPGISGGAPLPASVRAFMEPRFGANFGNVRIHTGASAAQQSRELNAHAFTVGEHVFFGGGKFEPESHSGRHLIAHELTHVIQQGAAVQRSENATIAQHSPPTVQRFSLSGPLDWAADKANLIPGFRLLTIVLGMNPINLAPVARSAANILRALLELIPVTGALLSQALDNYGLFAKAGAWIEAKIKALGLVGNALKSALDTFIDSVGWTGILRDPKGAWERAKRIFTEPIDKLIALGNAVFNDIVQFVRDAILAPLAKLAEGTRGYDLLRAVLGHDPITGEPVKRDAETLIGGFMKLIGKQEIWENIQKSHAVPRAWAWFQGALEGLKAFVRQIPALFVNALHSIELADLLILPKAFLKVAGVFGGFVLEFLGWAGNAVWKLLEIIFEVVSPPTLTYLRKTGAALKGILMDPMPFMRNLVRAAKLGFQNFADHFWDHLKAGLIDWLTGALPGVYIPKSFALGEIVKFVFSVLGLTWQNIRPKLVKVIGETAVKAMETGFDIVVTLVTEGPAAAWDKIQEQLANLKDMVIDGIIDFVVGIVVKKAVPKLISMFIPGAGFISAILSIYDTIMVFVQKISKIVAVVTSFIDSIVDIAAGAIEGAAKRVETTLAGLLSLAISFLAGFVGLGDVAQQVMGVILKIRATVDKAIDALIAWIVKTAKALFAKVFGKKDERTEEQKQADLDKAMEEAEACKSKPNATEASIKKELPAIQKKYRLTSLELLVDSEDPTSETIHVVGTINPTKSGPGGKIKKQAGDKGHPIEFTWVKPAVSGYPEIEVTPGTKKMTVGPFSSTKIGDITIGVTYKDALAVQDGACIQVKEPVTGNATKDHMNQVLNAHGYDREVGEGKPRDTDHIIEKQLGGPDALSNLWPLNASTNRSSGSTVRAQIASLTEKYGSLVGKWIKLKF